MDKLRKLFGMVFLVILCSSFYACNGDDGDDPKEKINDDDPIIATWSGAFSGMDGELGEITVNDDHTATYLWYDDYETIPGLKMTYKWKAKGENTYYLTFKKRELLYGYSEYNDDGYWDEVDIILHLVSNDWVKVEFLDGDDDNPMFKRGKLNVADYRSGKRSDK